MSGGSDLLSVLQGLGYPGAERLHAHTFDWMFEHQAMAPFLQWFCEEVQPGNLLDPREIQEFEHLERSEDGVLEGEQLEEALQNISITSDHETSEDKLRAELEELEEELKAAQNRKESLLQQRNKLSMHESSLGERTSRLEQLENAAKLEYKMALEQAQEDNTKSNNSLHGLSQAVGELSSVYHASSATSVPGVFLSQLPLDGYHKAEEKFTQELTAFTKKQFFQGIADMAGQSEGSRYEFLEISNPDSLLIRGEDEGVNLDDCKELARLQTVYPKSESQRISALMEEKSLSAACDFAERRCTSIKLTPYPRTVMEIKLKLNDAESVLSTVRRDVGLLSDQEIPHLLRDSATAQLTKILRGDYNLKITRQDYFTANQDQVIKQLVVQRARNEFLTMAYELEARGHRDTHQLLTAVTMLLQDTQRKLTDRMALMAEPSLSNAKHQRSTVDSRDTFLNAVHTVLDKGEDGRPMFLTYNQLAEDGEKLHHQVAALRASLSSTTSNHDDQMRMLESELRRCQSLVYSGGVSSSSQPVLSPQPVLDALTQLHAMLNRLEAAVRDIMKDVDTKKKSLKSDNLLAVERELFAFFYNDPVRLRRALDDLHARLQAQTVT